MKEVLQDSEECGVRKEGNIGNKEVFRRKLGSQNFETSKTKRRQTKINCNPNRMFRVYCKTV